VAYLNELAALAGKGVGQPPQPRAQTLGQPPGSVGVPAAQPHVEPPPYDAAMDPAWKGILNPSDHEFRNALNDMSPEIRQLLLTRLMSGAKPAVQPVASTPIAPGVI
jgi:hypothetical protein